MGLLKGLFNKMGNSHIRMLVKECIQMIIDSLRDLKHETNGKSHIGDILDQLIIEIGLSPDVIENYYPEFIEEDIEKKFKTYVEFYVVGKLGRKIDFSSGESTILQNEIDKYWLRIKTSDSFMNYG
ncbi:MAG: hypothetical protein HOG71_00360 [Bacteroidetes bacterium]|jgi:hypothetical protein|nr:hypothetical protein [Bacteroidota bacterium]